MLEPITSIPQTYHEMRHESQDQMARGIEQIGTSGERTKGVFNTALGALGYTLSPANAVIRTIVGKPLEENTGIPKEYSEFATSLALPVLGFGKVPKTVHKIFSPDTISQEAMDAAALIRQHTGRAARDTSSTAAALEPWWKDVSRLAPADQLGIMHYIEGTGAAPASPSLRAMADTMRDAFQQRADKIAAMPSHAHMTFVDEYFPHFWKDPQAAANAVQSGGFSKQGSGASLKARSVPTIAEGIRNGLEPLTTNPIEATLRYITSMDKFIAAQEMLNTAKANGTVVYRRPVAMGASGHPDSLKGVPQGYAPLEGRGATDATGARAYAPEDWARVYNNFISRGFDQIGGGEYGQVYNTLRRGANAVTQALLSFSGYHAFTMAEAGMSTKMANTIHGLAKGDIPGAAKEAAGYLQAPVAQVSKGQHVRDVYLGKSSVVSPQDREIVDLLTDAGGRMHNSKHALDYEASAMGDYVTSFRRGQLRGEAMMQARDMRDAPVMGTFRTVASNIGRVMDTFNKPLFQHYIPLMKNAAAYEGMAQFLRQNPAATQAEKLTAARKIVDSVDNRFGEMIHDNIFWNKVAKQSAMLAMLSYSWNMGAWRELGGGVRDAARMAAGRGEWTPKMSYTIGMTLNWAIMSAAYQYMKTGEAPKDIHDLAAPRTGGTDSRTGQPERIIPPGVMKDVFGYWDHFGQEVQNKLNPGLRIATQSASILGGMGGNDWRNDPILSPKDEEDQTAWNKAPDWLAEYFRFIQKGMSPIQSQQLGRGPEVGSALNSLELGLGIRSAPRAMVNPEIHEKARKAWSNRWRNKLRHDRQEQERYQGGSE